MGSMRFVVPRRDRLAPDAVERAYFAGLDDVPWQSRVQWTEEGLVLRRDEPDSGNFHIPWRVTGHGELVLSTGSLMEREQPYHLPLEIARGTLNRLRNQIALWQPAGLALSEEVTDDLAIARQNLGRAATSHQQDALGADEFAEQSLVASLSAMNRLSSTYSDQALSIRQQQGAQVLTLLGINLGCSLLKEHVLKQIVTSFNAAAVPLVWREIEGHEGRQVWSLCDRQIEWCRSQGMKICAGPLLELDRWSLPDWLYLWEGDDESLYSFVAGHVRAVVERYRGKVHLWNCASRLNVGDVLGLSEEQRLRLAVLAVETVKQADPRTPIVISIDQPWAEFMSQQATDLSPIYFADALVRADLGLAGIALELNVGYYPEGTQPRDLLDISRHLDRWACLGLPLLVYLTVPSSSGRDPAARLTATPMNYWAGGPTSASQAEWASQFLPLLLAKQPVQGVFWNQLLDSKPHDYAHGGLFDAQDQPKAAIEVLAAIKQKYC